MRVLREIGKAGFVLFMALAGLTIITAIHAGTGLAAALLTLCLGVGCLLFPQKRIWIDHGIVSISLILIAAFGGVVSLKQLSAESARQIELRVQHEHARLMALRSTNPKAYLAELATSSSPKWRAEFEALDPPGFAEFLKAEAAKAEAKKRAEIESHLSAIKSTPESQPERLRDAYYRLASLEPAVKEYDAKGKYYAKKVEEKLELEDMSRNPGRYVSMENFSWSKDGFGTVMMANFVIRNNNVFLSKIFR
jgi:hypothetical protein